MQHTQRQIGQTAYLKQVSHFNTNDLTFLITLPSSDNSSKPICAITFCIQTHRQVIIVCKSVKHTHTRITNTHLDIQVNHTTHPEVNVALVLVAHRAPVDEARNTNRKYTPRTHMNVKNTLPSAPETVM